MPQRPLPLPSGTLVPTNQLGRANIPWEPRLPGPVEPRFVGQGRGITVPRPQISGPTASSPNVSNVSRFDRLRRLLGRGRVLTGAGALGVVLETDPAQRAIRGIGDSLMERLRPTSRPADPNIAGRTLEDVANEQAGITEPTGRSISEADAPALEEQEVVASPSIVTFEDAQGQTMERLPDGTTQPISEAFMRQQEADNIAAGRAFDETSPLPPVNPPEMQAEQNERLRASIDALAGQRGATIGDLQRMDEADRQARLRDTAMRDMTSGVTGAQFLARQGLDQQRAQQAEGQMPIGDFPSGGAAVPLPARPDGNVNLPAMSEPRVNLPATRSPDSRDDVMGGLEQPPRVSAGVVDDGLPPLTQGADGAIGRGTAAERQERADIRALARAQGLTGTAVTAFEREEMRRRERGQPTPQELRQQELQIEQSVLRNATLRNALEQSNVAADDVIDAVKGQPTLSDINSMLRNIQNSMRSIGNNPDALRALEQIESALIGKMMDQLGVGGQETSEENVPQGITQSQINTILERYNNAPDQAAKDQIVAAARRRGIDLTAILSRQGQTTTNRGANNNIPEFVTGL